MTVQHLASSSPMACSVPTYHRAFFTVAIINLVALIVVSCKLHLNAFGTSTAAITNLLISAACRNEHIVNLLFTVFVNKARSFPLKLRRGFANIYCCYGGVHSGCATAALIWYIVFIIETTHGAIAMGPSVLMSWFILSLLLVIIVFALPCIRSLHHNFFECVHRYSSWTLLVMVIVQLLLTSIESASQQGRSPLILYLLADARLWEACVLVMFVIYPWLHLRKRNVLSHRLSSHALVLNFDYSDVSFGQAIRISDSPLRETHAFAVIPNIRSTVDNMSHEEAKLWHVDEKGFSVVISRAGDWTGRMIDNPPKHIWTRGVPQYGALRVTSLFKPCIVMATGSGIAPCLSIFVQLPEHPIRVIWSARSPRETYGAAIIGTVLRVDPSATIHDTTLPGRPDLVEIATNLWKEGNLEAVVFISNKEVTNSVIRGLKGNGVCAYGVIFDS